jgi:uncharacterized SAM-binding protein YcdF (DUF218 family)
MASLGFPLSSLFDPVFVLLLAAGVGLWLSRGSTAGRARAAQLGRALAWGAWLALWLLATPWVANLLGRALGVKPRDLRADLAATPPERRALIVLSAGINAEEFGEPAMERLSAPALERCLGAARVYRDYGGFGWVIVSGRDPELAPGELAGGMADLLVELGVPRSRLLLETESLDTRENALYSARMVRARPVDRVVVVTSAIHMRRAVRVFERAGLAVLPSPVKFQAPPPRGLEGVIPSSISLLRSHRVVHEVLGLLAP